MSENKLRALISWEQIFDHFVFDERGKIAALWFDEIMWQLSNDNYRNRVLENVADRENWRPETLKELKKIQISPKKYIPTYEFLDKNPWENDLKPLVDFVSQVTTEEILTSENLTSVDQLDQHEVAWVEAGTIDAIDLWMNLNSKTMCALLASKKEQKILEHLFFSASKSKPIDLFSEVLNSRIPDINNYSWDKIIELRNHPFLQNFREKVVCLHQQINTNNCKATLEIFNELVNRDIKEIITLFKPTMKNSIIKGIASNLPLPIPINPLSIYFSGKDIKRDMDISRKYGWLYFLIDISN